MFACFRGYVKEHFKQPNAECTYSKTAKVFSVIKIVIILFAGMVAKSGNVPLATGISVAVVLIF